MPMVVPAGEVVYDSDLDKYFLGDGVTLGGNEILGARYDAADGSITFNKLSQGTIDYIDASGGGGGVSDHGALTGLGDDDHTQYLLADGTRTLAGDLTVTGTVDGRDVAADGSKLDGIEAGAKDDQTADEVSFTNAEWAGAGASYNAADVDAALEQLLVNKAESSHTHLLADITDSGAMAAEADAPSDGTKYTRQNGAWVAADSSTIRSSTAPANTSVLWFHTTDQELYFYDTGRSKWLSVTTYEAHFSMPGTQTVSHYTKGPGNLSFNTDGKIGHPMRYPTTVTSAWGSTPSSTSGWEIRISKRTAAGSHTQNFGAFIPSGSYTKWSKYDFDLDYGEEDLMGLRFDDQGGTASSIEHHTAVIGYKRRPS